MNFAQTLPQSLADLSSDRLDSLESSLADLVSRDNPDYWRVVLAVSDYVTRVLDTTWDIPIDLIQSGDLYRQYGEAHQRSAIASLLEQHPDLDTTLRWARHREMTRIIFRDVNGLATLEETLRDLSNLADAAIGITLDHHHRNCIEEFGIPRGQSLANPQQLIVLALGKLGGRELNLSSDIDLIFFYDEQGMVDPAPHAARELSNQEFFIRLARRVIRSLDDHRADGFVFRVDMRLRPYGESGALVMCRSALEKYYLEQGRNWERYAFIKARFVAGDREAGESILGWLKPFVYRRHLDYGAIESLREMKALINNEVKRRDLVGDLKLGSGGIREVEFIAQCHQLIWGGKDARLQARGLIEVLSLLAERGDMPDAQVRELLDAYRFLRRSEHAVQAENDAQTQSLPQSDLSRARLALVMRFDNWEDYFAQLEVHRSLVRDHFSQLIRTTQEEMGELSEGSILWANLWRNVGVEGHTERTLRDRAFKDPTQAARLIRHIHGMLEKDLIPQLTVERYNRLMPALLQLVERSQVADAALTRLVPILETIVRRSTYVAFLLENPDAMTRMVKCCGASAWIAEQLRAQPVLLYELTDFNTHGEVPDRVALVSQLKSYMRTSSIGDLGDQMDELRRFKNGQQLRVAVLELSNLLPVMKVSDYLSWLAEVVLEQVVQLAWDELTRKHGKPERQENSDGDKDFAIIGYGKLGGLELSYGSDLDLVFIYDCVKEGNTDGARPVPNITFYTRLGQRILHIITSVTSAGVLYEIDMRLRPAGGKGLMVSTLRSFEQYQLRDAWTWEHQALVRSRFVAGDPALGARFEAIRQDILTRKRDLPLLRVDILTMRDRMRNANLAEPAEAPEFDLKHAPGAIVDIEFMIQYAALAFSATYPQVSQYSDNFRILEALEQYGVLNRQDVRFLQQAYLSFRSASHYKALGGKVDSRSFEQLNELRINVQRIWGELLHNEA